MIGLAKADAMIATIQQYIESHNLLPAAGDVLVGVSGGVDSMVLLHTLHALGYAVQCAHVNYHTRGDASDADQELVEAFCRAREIACHVHAVDDDFQERATGYSFQQVAREERYAFFKRLATQQRINRVAVAHHQNDQVETVLMNLMRGSGIEGLAGMAPMRALDALGLVQLIRPMLALPRDQIRRHAEQAGIPWREDATNARRTYLRNKIRHQLVERIRADFGEGAVQNIARSATYLQGYVEASFQPELYARFESVALPHRGLHLERLQRAPLVWQQRLILEALQRWAPGTGATGRHAAAIQQLLAAQVGRRVLLGDVEVWREREALRFISAADAPASHSAGTRYLIAPGDTVRLPGGSLHCRVVAAADIPSLRCGGHTFMADADRVPCPLTLRPWEDGDNFVPFGMQGHKKVSDFLTDIKIPSHERSQVHVLEQGGVILWIAGHRAAAGFEVTDTTANVLVCTWTPS